MKREWKKELWRLLSRGDVNGKRLPGYAAAAAAFTKLHLLLGV